jgi:hypothetical protein
LQEVLLLVLQQQMTLWCCLLARRTASRAADRQIRSQPYSLAVWRSLRMR